MAQLDYRGVVGGAALLAQLIGVISSPLTLISLRKRFPPGAVWETEADTRSGRRKQWKERQAEEERKAGTGQMPNDG
jgi:hypothetical protein